MARFVFVEVSSIINRCVKEEHTVLFGKKDNFECGNGVLLCVRPVDVNGSIDRLRTCEMKEKFRGGKAHTPYKYADFELNV